MNQNLQDWITQIEDIDRAIKEVTHGSSLDEEKMRRLEQIREVRLKMKINFIYDYLVLKAKSED